MEKNDGGYDDDDHDCDTKAVLVTTHKSAHVYCDRRSHWQLRSVINI